VVVALSATALLWPSEQEPVYQGKTLSQWLKIYNHPEFPTANDPFPGSPRPILAEPYDGAHDTNYGAKYAQREWTELTRRRVEAAAAVLHIGTNALPFLLRWLDQDLPMPWKAKLVTVRNKLPKMFQGGRVVNWWLVTSDGDRLALADSGFTLLGSNASPAVPELTRRMNTRKSSSGTYAILALAVIGTNGVSPMLAALTNTNTCEMYRVTIVLHLEPSIKIMGTNAGLAIEVLAKCVADKDPAVASVSAVALSPYGRLGWQTRQALPTLTALLNDSDPYVRNCATNALYQIAPDVLTNSQPIFDF
jgi:hypothetical protein